MKKIIVVAFLLCFFESYAQTQRFPVFPGCENNSIDELENCFNTNVKNAVLEVFRVPSKVVSEKFKGTVNVLFYVNRSGQFEVVHVNSPYTEIETEVERVFKSLPKVVPAQFNGHAVEMSFALPLHFPNPKLAYGNSMFSEISKKSTFKKKQNLSRVVQRDFKKEKFLSNHSNLNIPFHHARYAYLENEYRNAENTHTSVKPFIYKNVSEHVDLDAQKSQFLKKKSSWLGRKFWNEHLSLVKGDNYWFSTNMLLDVEMGKDNSDLDYTFNNSRILQIQGELGSKFSFSATIFESQGRFAQYVNDAIAIEDQKTFAAAGLIFGRGKAKWFKENSYDYPVSEGYISYTPNKFFNFQMGQGKNFIGDGYRSLLLSDVTSPYPYVKLSTTFWKIKYTNLWTWLTDIRSDVRIGKAHPRKYVSMHHLSMNVTKKLNIGVFEAVITDNSRTGSLDMDFVNPIIFYKSLEFARGEDAGSAILGINASYKFSKKFSMYGQFVLDEFTLSELKAQNGYWANKYGSQIGLKYFDAFSVEDLYIQAEYNKVRPYTFSHKTPIYNYGHYGESLAHSWGANFWEAVFIARYKKERWAANLKVVLGQKGFDPDPFDTDVSYGGDIYKPYTSRLQDYDNEVGQGQKATILNSDLQVSYLINPRTDLKIFTGFMFRDFSPETPTATFLASNTTWFTVGLKVDLFNWYLDF
ncbi:gliding motility protein RemB [Flavicella sediminum]|uniref:gliding motility protein RemB n=1 Tax=Flavicella sediminum TaxID=2585141 RepID=UPI00111F6D92|nr:gliding motility protein RemB [Flavicella sediminum]